MQIGSGGSPLSLAVMKALGSQAAVGGPSLPSSPLSAAGSASPSQNNEPAGPPEPGNNIPRGSFVDLKV
ncbi:hypothetical protein HBA54_06350 [Pelagibius litoralis]|uniref:Uncharacterized protein n=1 Tax=Pelagibius litoralis TaxID=374515 RepID=A0A967EWT1_9PROT|nr:hypothetical protein [Pelagibius litoralis]NIA68208.1 hypothetical protein [Pelagibius litoralis]